LLTERLFFLLFVFLLVLLLFSNLVIGYTKFCAQSGKTSFFDQPAHSGPSDLSLEVHRINLGWASWAFYFLIAPLLAPTGLTRGAALAIFT